MNPCADRHIQAPTENTGIKEIRVNGKLISESEIAAELQYHPADSAEDAIFKSSQALVIRELLIQKADTLKIQASPDPGETEEEARVRVLLECEINLPKADDKTCRHYYESNKHKFTSAPLLEVKHILLAAAPDDLEKRREMRDLAEELIQQLQKQPELFDEFAREFSSCPSKEQGGNLGQISKGQTVPEFEKQLFMLPAGLSTRPIESRYGFHVVMVNRRIEGQQLPYDACKSRIAHFLDEHAYTRAVSQYIDVLMGEASIEGMDSIGSSTPLVQ